MCCSRNMTPVSAIRIATIAPRRVVMKVLIPLPCSSRERSSAARLHQIAQAVARDVSDQCQHQDAKPWHHRNPPLLKEVTQVAGRVGTQLGRRRRLPETEE